MAFLSMLFPLLASALVFATAVVSLLCKLIEKNRQDINKEHELVLLATAVVSLLCVLIEKNRQHTNKEHEKSEPPPKAG